MSTFTLWTRLLLLMLAAEFGICESIDGDGDSLTFSWEDVTDPGDYSSGKVDKKEITLSGDGGQEKVEIHQKASLFSEHFKVTECAGSDCSVKKMTQKEERKVTKCTYEGRLKSDPSSVVAVTGCIRDGAMDISIISDTGKLKYNIYRVNNNGSVQVDKNANFSDVNKDKITNGEEEEEDDWEDVAEVGSDYSNDDNTPGAPRLPSYLRDGYTYTAVYVYDEEDESSSGGPTDCCRPTKSKCEGKNEDEVCKVNKGKTQCGKDCAKIIAQLQKLEDNQNAEDSKGDYSDSPLKTKKKKNKKTKKKKQLKVAFTLKASSKSKSKAKTKEKTKKPAKSKTKKKAEAKKKAKAKTKAAAKKKTKTNTKPKVKTKSKLKQKVESFEEYSAAEKQDTDGSSGSESEESFEGYSEPVKKKKKTKQAQKKDGKLSNKKLRMLETVSKRQYRSRNPLCKKKRNLFRSTQMFQVWSKCGSAICRKKDPYPSKKIYKKNTIEVGVYIDRHLYKNMEDTIKSQDSTEVKDALLKMVHQLMTAVETYLLHNSFSSKGGFKMVINGVVIYKKHGKMQADWDLQQRASDLLKKFAGFANKVNSACDGDQHGYDAMVLLTGRYDYRDMHPLGSLGYAYTGKVCNIAPVLILTMRLNDKGSMDMVMPRLLAHEFGHLLGSDHDGDTARGLHSVYKGQMVPCPQRANLMSPSVGMHMTTWSECTKKMIDSEYDRRKKENKNCMFT